METYSHLKLEDEYIEAGIVGTLLKKIEMSYYAESIQPNMFYHDEYQGLFWALKDLADEGVESLDDFTIINKLRESPYVYSTYKEAIENREFSDRIHKLKLLGTDDVAEFNKRLERLITFDFRRTAPNRLEMIAENIRSDDSSSVNELNGKMHSEIMDMSSNYLSTGEFRLLGDDIDKYLEEIDSRANNDGTAGLPSKYPILNNFFSYENGELILIAGRPKSGKSVIILNEVWHKISNGIGVLVLDTELPTRQWVERLLAHVTGMTVARIKSGKRTQEERDLIMDVRAKIKSGQLAHIYLPEKYPDYKFEDLFMITKAYQQKMGNLGLLAFDYIKANKVSGIQMQEHQYLGDLTNYLKNDIAGRLNIPILASGQMNDNEDRMADSAKIARYASVIAYWIKKDMEEVIADGKECGTHKIFIDYNRLGRQMDKGSEYINMVADLDRMSIKQSKIQTNLEGNKPYE